MQSRINLDTFSISSSTYKTIVTDGGLFKIIQEKGVKYNDLLLSVKESEVEISNVSPTEPVGFGDGIIKDISSKTRAKSKKITEIYDTSKCYSRPFSHLDLWARISCNSSGKIPKTVDYVTERDIRSADIGSVQSYTTASRGIRKCCLTVFTYASKHAVWSMRFAENSTKRPYSCSAIGDSVRALSKNTHAGVPTMGKKNNENNVKYVINVVRDIFRKPTARKVIRINPMTTIDNDNDIFRMPELIFHRFQAIYNSSADKCFEKCRLVWCVPFTVVSLENIFFGKIIKNCKKEMQRSNECIYPLGLDNYSIGKNCVGSLRKKFHSLDGSDYKIYSLDFSKFDSTIPQWAKDLFFCICSRMIDMNQNQKKVYDLLRLYVKFTPFVWEGNVMFKQKGISSGLLITNLFDTWWNLTLHYFVYLIEHLYPEAIPEILSEDSSFERLYLDASKVKYDKVFYPPMVRVMGDDSIILCNERTLLLLTKICSMLGMTLGVKHVTERSNDDIFFLGRYWDSKDRPFQTEEHIALRIVYTKWYNDSEIPFDLKDLQLNRILSICLPFTNGKEFLDKYLFDYPPYSDFVKSDKGFVYMKDFIENTFRFVEREKLFNVDTY